jgi:pyruvate kinase
VGPATQPLPLLAFTSEPSVRNQLALTWGTKAFLVTRVETTDAMVRLMDHAMLSVGRFQPGDPGCLAGRRADRGRWFLRADRFEPVISPR